MEKRDSDDNMIFNIVHAFHWCVYIVRWSSSELTIPGERKIAQNSVGFEPRPLNV